MVIKIISLLPYDCDYKNKNNQHFVLATDAFNKVNSLANFNKN